FLFAFFPLIHRTEMLESPYAGNSIKDPKLLRPHRATVSHIHPQTIATTCLCLPLGKCKSDAVSSFFLDIFRKRSPATAHIQDLVSPFNLKAAGNVLMFGLLGFFQG